MYGKVPFMSKTASLPIAFMYSAHIDQLIRCYNSAEISSAISPAPASMRYSHTMI